MLNINKEICSAGVHFCRGKIFANKQVFYINKSSTISVDKVVVKLGVRSLTLAGARLFSSLLKKASY
jgi:hypothetical protein